MDNILWFKICLSISLIGILILFIYTGSLSLDIKDISLINKEDLNKFVKVNGQVTSIRDLPGILILSLKDKTSQIKVIIFKEDELKIKKNDILEIEGIVKEYKEELEIQAEKVTKK